MKKAISLKLPSSVYTKLREVSVSKRLPVAIMLRNLIIDWLEDF
jgi:predicted DNA-binding protein